MSVSIVQQAAASTTSASVVVPLTTAVQSGDTLIASVCMVGGASVSSVTDTLGGRWIQTARSYQADAGTELWTSRGRAQGSASVTVNFTIPVSAGVNVLEASGLWYASPLDQWTQYNSTVASAGVTPPTTNTTPTLSAPSTPTVTVEGTAGSTTYSYEVTATNSFGETLPSAAGSTTTGNATLSSTDYNLAAWDAVPLPAGSPGNLVYDSNLTNAIASVGATWTTSGNYGGVAVTLGTANGDWNINNPGTDSAEWVYYGTGSASDDFVLNTQLIDVTPGSTYYVSAFIDATAVASGAPREPCFELINTDFDAEYTYMYRQSAGVSGVVGGTWTCPAGVTQVYGAVMLDGAVVTAGDTVSWSQIQLTETSTVQPYAPGPLWTYDVYRELEGSDSFDLIGTTTALAFEDTGTSIVIPQTVVPRGDNELVITVCSTNASVGVPGGSYTALSMAGGTNFAAAYNALNDGTSPTLTWPTDAATSWATVQAAFIPGASGLNPNLQFPETSVQLCTQSNWQAPFSGAGIWTELAPYVESFSAGPIGRQHELDRVQAAPATITLNNRTGEFNPWNTESFVYGNGSGMKPMNPVKITAAWNGITYPVYYGYFQSITNAIKDVLNVDATLACIDILQILSLKYLSGANYADLVEADGGSNLEAYYRLGDMPGSYSVKDSSGNGRTGSLINGLSGEPLYGQVGAFLYDPNTSVDLTNGTNKLNGGITTTDYSTQPPTVHEPLGSSSASVWTFECWEKWTGGATTLGVPTTFVGGPVLDASMIGFLSGTLPAIGDLITGAGVASGTFVSGLSGYAGGTDIILIKALTTEPSSSGETYSAYAGGVGSTLFSATTPAGQLDVRFGTYDVGDTILYDAIIVGVASNGIGQPLVPLMYAPAPMAFDGNWHHLVVTMMLADTSSVTIDAQLYLDGVYLGGALGVTWAPATDVTIGCDAGPANGFIGWIQDVALYSTVLTQEQIQHHYEVGKWFQAIELGAANGSAEAARLNKVLAVSGLDPTTMLVVPSGIPFKTYLYAETNPVTTTSGLNYMQTTSETEPALIFQGPDGVIYAYGRQYQYLADVATTSQGIFGDNISTAAYHYEGTTLTMTQDDLDVFNDIQVQSGRGGYQAGAGYVAPGGIQGPANGVNANGGQLEEFGPGQSQAMALSASVYGDRTLQGLTSLQFEYDSIALAVAQNYGRWYGFPIMRIESMTLNSYADGGVNMPQILGRGLYDRVTVEYQGQVSGPKFSQDSVIESISHSVTISSGPVWSNVFALSPYEILLEPTILGTFAFGASGPVLTL